MKKLLVILLACLTGYAGSAQNAAFAGDWLGSINVGVDLRIVFHFKTDGTRYTTTIDSPDQSAFGIPTDSTVVNNDKIEVYIKRLGASFTGTLVNDSTIEGNFVQGNTFPLTLKRTYSKIENKRPQEPKPPFTYRSEDVEYDNAEKSLHYGATLTIPNGTGPFPAVVLITGSGAQNRDETLMGHKPFLVLADVLTKNGIVVLRVDDRGMGKSTGIFNEATTADFAKDVSTSLDFLKNRSEADPKKLGLVGHSEGGMIAPMVATSRNDIAFIILLAGPGIKIEELMIAQNEAILLSSGISKKALDKYMPAYRKVMNIMTNTDDSTKAINESINYLAQWKNENDTTIVKELGLESNNAIPNMVHSMVKTINGKWFRYFIKFDPQPYLQKLKGKVLALNGDKDIQVIAGPNLAGIQSALKKSKVKSYTVKAMPGLNHLFQTCKSCTVNEYSQLEETFSPDALKEINDWLNKEIK